MLKVLLAATLLLAPTSSFPAKAQDEDPCEDTGRLVAMMMTIKEQCPKYALTADGEAALINLSVKMRSLGGRQCLDRRSRAPRSSDCHA